MLQFNELSSGSRRGASSKGDASAATIKGLSVVVRRQLPVFVLVFVCCLAGGILYLAMTPASYTATGTMVIDTKKIQLFQQQSILGEMPVDAATVQTEIEMLKSQNISRAVIKTLHLTDDPEFVPKKPGFAVSASGKASDFVHRVLGGLLGQRAPHVGSCEAASDTGTCDRPERQALQAFESRRTVNRVGLTFVMEISVRSNDPDKSALIANAIAEAYIADQLEAKYLATRRAGAWLQDRIQELRQQTTEADRAVVNFRQANNIVAAGTGQLMNEQQVSEVDSQLVIAHASTVAAKAQLDRIDEIMGEEIPDASVADALKSEVIIKLRQQYLDLAGRKSILATRFGPAHLAVVSLQSQMDELRRNVSDEMRKIAQSYKSEYQIALAREVAIKSSLEQSVTNSKAMSQAQIKLRELESSSQSYRSMYDNFLQRYMQAVQQESFPITEARVISPAAAPLTRSQPNTTVALAVTVIGGLMASFAAAVARDATDRVFRSSRQVEARLKIDCIATLPALRFSKHVASGRDAGLRQIVSLPPMLRYAIDKPFSHYTEALRSVKVRVDLGHGAKANRIIGITSTVPGEGKTTTASNLAHMIAHAGSRVLLVDSDLRSPSLSHILAPNAEKGLIDVLAGHCELDAAAWSEESAGLTFLPAGGQAKPIHTNEILASKSAKDFFARARERYDYVIVDLAPLVPVVDTRTTTGFIDTYVYVVEWGGTRADIVEHTLEEAREVYDRVLGVVLNKVDMKHIGRFEQFRRGSYYEKYYKQYVSSI